MPSLLGPVLRDLSSSRPHICLAHGLKSERLRIVPCRKLVWHSSRQNSARFRDCQARVPLSEYFRKHVLQHEEDHWHRAQSACWKQRNARARCETREARSFRWFRSAGAAGPSAKRSPIPVSPLRSTESSRCRTTKKHRKQKLFRKKCLRSACPRQRQRRKNDGQRSSWRLRQPQLHPEKHTGVDEGSESVSLKLEQHSKTSVSKGSTPTDDGIAVEMLKDQVQDLEDAEQVNLFIWLRGSKQSKTTTSFCGAGRWRSPPPPRERNSFQRRYVRGDACVDRRWRSATHLGGSFRRLHAQQKVVADGDVQCLWRVLRSCGERRQGRELEVQSRGDGKCVRRPGGEVQGLVVPLRGSEGEKYRPTRRKKTIEEELKELERLRCLSASSRTTQPGGAGVLPDSSPNGTRI